MTVKELAELAGVSPATISLVLNNKKGVSEKKRQEILELIKEHGYSAVKKEEPKKNNILFIKYFKSECIVEENRGFISQIVSAVESECQKQNYNLTIRAVSGNISEALRNLKYSDYFGVILLGTELEPSDFNNLRIMSIPFVVVDNSMPYCNCNSVSIDNKENVFKVVEYYAKQGYTEIGYFKGEENLQNFKERAEGLFEAAEIFDIKITEDSIFEVPTTMLGAFEVTQKYINQGRKIPKCIFTDNDIIAIGVIKALQMVGFDIPEDISVIGFDNIPFSKVYSPTISTINVDTHLLGRISLMVLQNMREQDDFKNVKVKVGGDLILRQSTIKK